MAAETKPVPMLGVVDADHPGHVRLTLDAADGIAARLLEQEERIAALTRDVKALRVRCAVMETANDNLLTLLDRAEAQGKAWKAQLEHRTVELMRHHEGAVRAFNESENSENQETR